MRPIVRCLFLESSLSASAVIPLVVQLYFYSRSMCMNNTWGRQETRGRRGAKAFFYSSRLRIRGHDDELVYSSSLRIAILVFSPRPFCRSIYSQFSLSLSRHLSTMRGCLSLRYSFYIPIFRTEGRASDGAGGWWQNASIPHRNVFFFLYFTLDIFSLLCLFFLAGWRSCGLPLHSRRQLLGDMQLYARSRVVLAQVA